MVFKGVLDLDLHDGRTSTSHVAVKRLARLNPGEFEKEIKMLSELRHANLVYLVGYCDEQFDEKILVYEFMPNGSLRDNLYRKPCSLSWEQRLNICIGAARGLDHLHTGTSLDYKIIHRDVKPDNILLDKSFAAKISDFGLSKRGPANQTHSSVITAHVRGTPGYYAPEYISSGKITWRVDVYAFGVVLFEVLCKKTPWVRDDSSVDNDESLGKWAQRNVDPDLKGEISQSCLEAFIDIGEKCLTKDPDQRPSMNEVVTKLNHASKLQKSSSKVENDLKRSVDSGSSSKSSDSAKSLEHGDNKRSKLPQSDETSPDGDDSGSGGSAIRDKTSQEGGSKNVDLTNSTKSSEEIKSRQETRACKSLRVENELGLQHVKREDGKILENFNNGGEATNSEEEDTTRDNSNAGTLPDIPGTEDKVVLYWCSSGVVADYMTVRFYLNRFRVDIDERDPTMNEKYQVELSRFFTQKKEEFSFPQLFIGGKYVGGANEVVRLHDSGELGKYLAVYQN